MILRHEGAFWRGPPRQGHPFRGGDLLHGEECDVWGDQAYQGQSEIIKEKAPKRATAPIGATGTAVL